MTDSLGNTVTAWTQCPSCARLVPALERCTHCGRLLGFRLNYTTRKK